MKEQNFLKQKIYEIKFAIHELELYLDTHPTCRRTLALLKKYRALYAETVAQYEAKYGRYMPTRNSVPAEGRWQWIDGPWPWEIHFTEE